MSSQQMEQYPRPSAAVTAQGTGITAQGIAQGTGIPAQGTAQGTTASVLTATSTCAVVIMLDDERVTTGIKE